MKIQPMAWFGYDARFKRIEIKCNYHSSLSFSCDKSTCKSCRFRFQCWTTIEELIIEDENLETEIWSTWRNSQVESSYQMGSKILRNYLELG